MAFQFPAEYVPAFADVADLVADMVQTELDRCTPGGWAGTFRPGDADARVRVAGRWNITDNTSIQAGGEKNVE